MNTEKIEALFNQMTLFTGGEHGYKCYRIPALVVSTRGTILAFCEARRNSCSDFGDIDIILKRSFDHGKTFEEMQVIAVDGKNTIHNPCPVVDKHTGAIWLPFCKNYKQVFVMNSKDDGATWGEPVEITKDVMDPTWYNVGSGPGHGIQLMDGKILIPSWAGYERDWGPQLSYVFFSDDGGTSWKRGEALSQDQSDECETVQTVDGSLYMNMRSRQGKKRRAYAWSKDGGLTWSKVKFDSTLPEPSCQGSLVRFTDKESFQKNRVLLCAPASTTKRAKLTVRLSYDECQTWPVSKLVNEGSSAYSDLAIAPDMTILCLYEADEYSNIVLARFNIEWLTDGTEHLRKKA